MDHSYCMATHEWLNRGQVQVFHVESQARAGVGRFSADVRLINYYQENL